MMHRRRFLTLAGAAATTPFLFSQRTSATTSLHITPMTLELAKGIALKTTGYNNLAPGPILRFREGEQVHIDVYNHTQVPELVHWHGLAIDPLNDGAMEEGSPMIPPGGHLRYSFQPKPSGTRWYHTHTAANRDLIRATYTGQFGFLYIEPKHEPGSYDQEIFLAIHHWQPSLFTMGAPMNANDVMYRYATFNDKLHTAAEPIRVRYGQRVLFRLLNASATEAVQIALPGHRFTVITMDGNPVPQPTSVETLTLAVGERIDAIVQMDSPGIWLLGAVDDANRTRGLARTIEYAGSTSKPLWAAPDNANWSYLRFASNAEAPKPDELLTLTFAPKPADAEGMQHWTVNGAEYSQTAPIELHPGKRHRIAFVNASAEPHPLHLHRHSMELISIGKQRCSGLMKDILNIPPNTTMEADVIADNPGDSLFHCHQQLHMDYGFMALFKYKS